MDDTTNRIGDPGAVWLRSDALTLGYHDRAIARLVRCGDWHRIRQGAYTSGVAWAALDASGRHALMARAVLRQARTEVVLSHVSGLPEFGCPTWEIPLDTVHVTRPDQRAGRQEAGVNQHAGLLLPHDVVIRNGVPVTSATRLALDLTTVVGTEPCLVVFDHLLRRGLTSHELLCDGFALMEHWPRTLHTDLVIRLADGRAESPGETRSRYLCWKQGLPAPVPQYKILGRGGEIVAVSDLAWPGHGVFAEFDGKVKYGALLKEGEAPSDVVLREKRREDLIRELTGWRCIRLVWADLHSPEHTAARIHRMLYPETRAA